VIALTKRYTNGHADPDGKCPIEEAVTDLLREADEVREAVRQRKHKRTQTQEHA
jgi:hypothetical protein